MTRTQEWSLEEAGDLRWIRCAALSRISGLVHGFSVARDSSGVVRDFGQWPPEGEVGMRNRREFAQAIGAGAQNALGMRQVHGDRIHEGSADALGADAGRVGDGWVARRLPTGGPLLEIRVADCVPVLLADESGTAVAAVHSGWRGTATGVVRAAVRRLEGWGTAPNRLIAALGPAISGKNYEVGPEVLDRFSREMGIPVSAVGVLRPGHDNPGIDLRHWIREQLLRTGVPDSRIHTAPWCTYSEPALFHSYRRQGASSGRMVANIGWPVP